MAYYADYGFANVVTKPYSLEQLAAALGALRS
jgi:hypothetical protein